MSKKSRLRKIRRKKGKLKRKYPTIKKGMEWWKSLTKQDKNAFIRGFIKNKHAEEIQKKEIEFNRLKGRISKLTK